VVPSPESTKQTGVKYAQFSLVGVSNALVDLGVLNLLLLIAPTWDPELLVGFNIVALVVTNANSYLWNTLWTFRRQARHNAKQMSMFGAQALLNIGVANLVLWGLAYELVAHTDFSAQISGNVAKVGSMLVASTMSFLLLRIFVFRKTGRRSEGTPSHTVASERTSDKIEFSDTRRA
jgi:putative flippase GtrA